MDQTAYLSNRGEYTTFSVGDRTITFLTSKNLEKYIEVVEWDQVSGGELTAEVTADYLRREHLPDRAFSSEKARYHRPAGTMPEEGVVIQRRYNKSQAA